MDLICHEETLEAAPKHRLVRAGRDPVLVEDGRVWRNLTILEKKYALSESSFCSVQTEVQPYMRRILTGWMLQVCEEQRCEEEVFPLSVQYLDRYMAQCEMSTSSLQLLGSACMFLASKLRDSVPLSAVDLCTYTDNAFSLTQLLQWELLVVSRLNWDLASVLPSDFLEPLLKGLPIIPPDPSALRKHTHTYIALAATEFTFSTYLPSVIACSCVAAAARRLNLLDGVLSCDTLLQLMANLLDTDLVSLCNCHSTLEETLKVTLPTLAPCTSGSPVHEVSSTPVTTQEVKRSRPSLTEPWQVDHTVSPLSGRPN